MAPKHLIPVLMGVFLMVIPAAGYSAVLGKKLGESLKTAAPGTILPVIVSFADKASLPTQAPGNVKERRDKLVKALRTNADRSQRSLKDFLLKRGVMKVKSLWIINALAMDADAELIELMSLQPGVEGIRLNGTVTVPKVVPQQVAGEPEWNISAVGADLLWNLGLTGQGAVVASLDSGVDALHPDLRNKWRGWNGTSCDPQNNPASLRDWFDPYGEHPDCPYDRAGHGTNVTGVMVGGDARGTAIGVAPDAAWIAAKIFNDNGNATYDAIHLGFQWALDPDGNGDTGDAPNIVNNSWGLDGVINSCDNPFADDIHNLKAAGIAVVFSAGNTGPNPSTSISPANYQESMAVGATDIFDTVADFSGRGPNPCTPADPIYPEVSAPGSHIRTSDLSFGGLIPDSYIIGDGTSLAAPHVSGVMALLMGPAGFPLATLDELETALQFSATDLGVEGPDNDFGYGQVNALAAYKRLAGLPYLAVYDPKPPEHDLALDFGSIPVGLDVVRTIVIRNSGGGILTLPVNALTPPAPPFYVVSDTCSGVDLASDASCRIGLQFSPTADVVFNGSFSIASNDTDQNPAVITLTGTGNLNPLPPQIVFSAVGQTLDFGSVSPGATSAKTLVISNSGEEFLAVSRINPSLLPAQFAVTADNCTGVDLAVNESCSVIFSFTPDSLNTFHGSVNITSNDPDQNLTTISLVGIGNNPPKSAILHSPPNGAAGLSIPVTFQWFHPVDPDGDQVTDTVRVSELTQAGAGIGMMNFITALGRGFPVNGYVMLLAAALSLFLFGKTKKSAFFAIIAAGLLLLNSCGGGNDAPVTMAGNTESFTVTTLKSGTTYNWKVVSEDGKGGVSESASWSFTTR